MNFIGYRVIKTSIGATAAMLIAKELNLNYYVSAGIIAMLSIQNTKIKSIKTSIQRIGAVVLALLISSILFEYIGYSILVFGLYLVIFIPITVKLKVSEGIIVSTVIVSHLLGSETINISVIGNEVKLILIGTIVGLLLNIYIPSEENKIKKDKNDIEEMIRQILLNMSESLRYHYVSIKEEDLFNETQNRLNIAYDRAYKNLNNYIFVDESYYFKYIEMRIKQFETIKRMRLHFKRFYMTYDQTCIVADFTEKVANCIGEKNSANNLIDELNDLRKEFKKMDLPKNRDEFENRAMLLHFFNDIEVLLEIKNEFIFNIKK